MQVNEKYLINFLKKVTMVQAAHLQGFPTWLNTFSVYSTRVLFHLLSINGPMVERAPWLIMRNWSGKCCLMLVYAFSVTVRLHCYTAPGKTDSPTQQNQPACLKYLPASGKITCRHLTLPPFPLTFVSFYLFFFHLFLLFSFFLSFFHFISSHNKHSPNI